MSGASREAIGGRVLLRIEDHDRERCRPEFETGILDDLDWLGFAPDVFATRDFRTGRCDGRQSDRARDYLEAVQILAARGLVYGCDCSRKDILDATDATGSTEELYYPGTCRNRGLPLSDEVGWRVRLDSEPNESELFDDAMLGPQSQDPMIQCGDLLIRDRRGNWTYQFAVTVDDWRQQIDLVIRGRDLLASTGRQIRLARMLGRERPAVFMHHPLIMKSADQKLSKSDRDTGVRDLRASGGMRRECSRGDGGHGTSLKNGDAEHGGEIDREGGWTPVRRCPRQTSHLSPSSVNGSAFEAGSVGRRPLGTGQSAASPQPDSLHDRRRRARTVGTQVVERIAGDGGRTWRCHGHVLVEQRDRGRSHPRRIERDSDDAEDALGGALHGDEPASIGPDPPDSRQLDAVARPERTLVSRREIDPCNAFAVRNVHHRFG